MNDAVTVSTTTAVSNGVVQSNSTGTGAGLTVHYEAATASYTLNMGNGDETFTSDELSASSPAGTAVYNKPNGSESDSLTLHTVSTSTLTPYPYGGMGVWQQTSTSGGDQTTTYTPFTYGMQTPTSGLPRTGAAEYSVDLIGYVTQPGSTLKSLAGQGLFAADFLSSLFKAQVFPNETDMTTGSSVGTGVGLVAYGHLYSTTTAFSGTTNFQDGNGYYTGPFDGRFYGPAAQNVGVSFSGYNSSGGSVVGSLFGANNGAAEPYTNLTLANIITEQLFATQAVQMFTIANDAGGTTMIAENGNLTLSPDGSVVYASTPPVTFTSANLVASSRPNFTTYQETVNGEPTELDVYKAGASNTELALSYMDLAVWRQGAGTAQQPDQYVIYNVFGIATAPAILARLTGSAQYTGVAYGDAMDGSSRYNVTGASTYSVNFSSQNYTGSLTLNGANVAGGAGVSFGTFTFSSNIGTNGESLQLSQGGTLVGQLSNQFYGPAADETGGSFLIQLKGGALAGGIEIVGATAAKRQ